MKKALMYLFLALGIIVAVVLVSGAVMGFVAGFIDGYNESNPGATKTSNLVVSTAVIIILSVCTILNAVRPVGVCCPS